MLKIKRIYDDPEPDDGNRILVDRLWPRGVSKEKAKIDEWDRDIAPSNELRKWYSHDPEKWEEFKERYKKELESNGETEEIERLRDMARHGNVTLLFSATDEKHSNAAFLRELILK